MRGRPILRIPGLLDTEEISLLVDRYEVAMVASYVAHGMDGGAMFEQFVRRLPPHREWLLAAGLAPPWS